MKEPTYLSERIEGDDLAMLERICSNKRTFVERARELDLNPRSDFKYADLVGCDFSNCDLSDFDFTGSDLRYCFGLSVIWDRSVLELAKLEDSLFATPDDISRLSQENPEWETAFRLISGENDADSFAKIVAFFKSNAPEGKEKAYYLMRRLFLYTKSPVVRTNMLYCMATFAPRSQQTREFIMHIIATNANDVRVMRSVLSAMADMYFSDKYAIKTFQLCLSYHDENVRLSAVRGLSKSPSFIHNANRYSAKLRNEKSALVRRAYLESLASRMGVLDYIQIDTKTIDFSERLSVSTQRKMSGNAAAVARRAIRFRSESERRAYNDSEDRRFFLKLQIVLLRLIDLGVPLKMD